MTAIKAVRASDLLDAEPRGQRSQDHSIYCCPAVCAIRAYNSRVMSSLNFLSCTVEIFHFSSVFFVALYAKCMRAWFCPELVVSMKPVSCG